MRNDGTPHDRPRGRERRAAILASMLAAEVTGTPEEHAVELALLHVGADGWTPAEVTVMLRRATEHDTSRGFEDSLKPVLTAAQTLDADGCRAIAPWVRHADRKLRGDASQLGSSARLALLEKIRLILAKADEAWVPDGVIPGYDAWAAPLRARANEAPTRELGDLVRHLTGLSGPRPSQTWRRCCLSLVAAASAGDLMVGGLRGLAGAAPPNSDDHGPRAGVPGDDHGHRHLVHPDHGDLARGTIWAAALTAGPSAVPSLVALALRTGGPRGDVFQDLKLAGAAINALGAVEDPASLEGLLRLESSIRHRALRRQLDTAIETAAGRQGVTRAQLVERSVPGHGLGRDGSSMRELGGYQAVVGIEDPATVRLSFTGADSRLMRTVPAALREPYAEGVGELKALVKAVRGTLSSERARIEGLMSGDRVWTFAEWRRHYRDHPITGVLTRGLIWEFEGADGEWAVATPGEDVLVTVDGQALPRPGDDARVRLWHPIRETPARIRAWRGFVTRNRMRQPFKQAFREIYLLTPAEEETRVYSNRFAAHIVHYRRLYALIKRRGWQAGFLGPYDGGHDGEAYGAYAEGEWRACFHHQSADEDNRYAPDYAATDQVRFERRAGGRWREAPLAEVPPRVFSEAMRDVDMFVAVTSITADPDWIDRGERRHGDYWRTMTFGELTASAEMRRDALRRLLPRTRIAARCALDGRYLVVRGDLRTYKIHLGSANILMEPDDSYLCIVPSRRSPAPGKVFLPFEDERLTLILSKAFLLAADAQITDETILLQIRRGGARWAE